MMVVNKVWDKDFGLVLAKVYPEYECHDGKADDTDNH